MRTILLILLFSVSAQGQVKFTKNDAAIIVLQTVSGFAMGWHEAIQAGHVQGNNWKNKYRNWPEDTREAFPGSKSIFVGFTDDYHKSNLITNTANLATLTIALCAKGNLTPLAIIKKVLLSVLANRLASAVSYNVIFKQK